jgi:hypothetical protein
MRQILRFCLVLVAGFTVPQTRASSLPAITITVLGSRPSNADFTLGWEFTVNQKVTVSMLGLFDDGMDGFLDRHSIGIWSSDGALLGTAAVTPGTSDLLVDQFRYASLDNGPVVLASGRTYEIGALYLGPYDPVTGIQDSTDFASNSSIAFDRATYAGGSTLTSPNESIYTVPGYFGPNFLVDTTSEAPEGGTFFLAAFGSVGMVVIPSLFRLRTCGAEQIPSESRIMLAGDPHLDATQC